MNIITVVTVGFLVLETANILTLYFFPDTKYANGIGVFNAWEKSKNNPEVHDLVKYLVNWVAGTKLIFVLLLSVILIWADDRTLIFAGVSLVISIATFFWRLFPLIRKMDRRGQIDPKHYSLTLGWMIGGFILLFSASILYTLWS